METIQMLGSLGEFVGAIAVVATPVYLAIQVRHSKAATDANTRSMDEGMKLAKAQAYQSRAGAVQQTMFEYIRSDQIPIQRRLREAGWPENEAAIDELEPDDRDRLYVFEVSRWTMLDNIHFQHQQGFVDGEYYEHQYKWAIRGSAPAWNALGRPGVVRPTFLAEVDQILAEAEEQS